MGSHIRSVRKRAGASVEYVAYRIGISPERLQLVESGRDTLGVHHWPALKKVLPEINLAYLETYIYPQELWQYRLWFWWHYRSVRWAAHILQLQAAALMVLAGLYEEYRAPCLCSAGALMLLLAVVIRDFKSQDRL